MRMVNPVGEEVAHESGASDPSPGRTALTGGLAEQPMPDIRTLIFRGWGKKCPHCGEGDLYQRWMRLHERCPRCGLKYLESHGDLLGPLMFLDRVLFMVPIIVFFYFGVWRPTAVGFVFFGGATLFLLLYTMPHRNGVSVAIDYLIRRKEGDLRPPG